MHMSSINEAPRFHHTPQHIPQHRHSLTPQEHGKEHRRHGSASAYYNPVFVPGSGSGRSSPPRSSPQRQEELVHPQPHAYAHNQSLPPPPAAYPSFHAQLPEQPRSHPPTELELRGLVPRAWSPSAGVRRK